MEQCGIREEEEEKEEERQKRVKSIRFLLCKLTIKITNCLCLW